MPRWRAKRPPEQDAPARSGRALFAAGTIRNPGERESLAVTLSIGRGQVSLHADDLELGAWPEESVEIAPIDATSFAFTAEGDRMIFRPEDVLAFTADLGTNGTITASPAPGIKDAPKRRTRRRRRAKAVGGDAVPPTPDAANGQSAPNAGEADVSSPPPEETHPPTAKRSMPKLTVPKVPARKSSARQASVDVERTERVQASDGRPSLWLRTIDAARHQGWFSLDRVPVYEDQRGQDHDHTWNHRAVATSGLSRHVCTICGKVKLR